MDNDVGMSAAIRDLGRSLRPLLQRLHSELASATVASRRASDPVRVVSGHLHLLEQIPQRLTSSIHGLNADVLDNRDAVSIDVERAVGRLASCLDELLDGYREARSLRAIGPATEILPLLAGVYRHLLSEIAPWLERMVRVLADPATEIAKQGLSSSDTAEVDLILRLNIPPQLNELHQWARRQASQPAKPGSWGVLTSMLLGWGLASALVGGDCDCEVTIPRQSRGHS